MKTFLYIFTLIVLLTVIPDLSEARRGWQGCCSHHGGITYQCVRGRMLCNDGTLSPSCFCNDGMDSVTPTQPLFTPRKKAAPRGKERVERREGAAYGNQAWITSPHRNGIYTMLAMSTDNAGFEIGFSPTPSLGSAPTYRQNGSIVFVIPWLNIPFSCPVQRIGLNCSIDGNPVIPCNVMLVENFAYSMRAFFQPLNNNFWNQCKRGNRISFNIKVNDQLFSYDFSLSGFTRSYDQNFRAVY